MPNFILKKSDTVVMGPLESKTPLEAMVLKRNRVGGEIKEMAIVYPAINPRFEMIGGFIDDWSTLRRTYEVIQLSTEDIHRNIKTEIAAEAERRIISLWVPESKPQTLQYALMYQQNASRVDETDPRFTQTDAIRTASNDFEVALADMELEDLAALDVREWEGWPDED